MATKLTTDPPPRKCRLCKQTGGPWPNGDRPKTLTLASGCPRCGWCY